MDHRLQSLYMVDLRGIPEPSERRLAIRVKSEAERSLRSGHPWLFEDSIIKVSHPGSSGDLAVVFDRKNRFIGVGLYDPYSIIRVRILQHMKQELINQEWFSARINKAIALRSSIDTRLTNGYRLVHGENDGLPGLIVDRYESNLVFKIYTSAWVPYLKTIIPIFEALLDVESIVLRIGRTTSLLESELYGLCDGMILKGGLPERPSQFSENGLLFEVDFVHGHKTGFYLDQRENRARLEHYILLNNGPIHMLNLFAYSGAFALYAARAGARDLTSVDVNEKALEAAKHSFKMNGADANIANAQHKVLTADVFEFVRQLKEEREKYNVIVVDPPSFARRRSQVEPALKAYERLAQNVMALLKPGGMLAMFSCSSQVSEDLFFERILLAASSAGRSLREIERSRHPVDHPIGFAQGAYLKGLFTYVD